MENLINQANTNLTESNMRGVTLEARERNAEFPVTISTHPTSGHGNLVAIYEGETFLFNYDLDADVVF